MALRTSPGTLLAHPGDRGYSNPAEALTHGAASWGLARLLVAAAALDIPRLGWMGPPGVPPVAVFQLPGRTR